MPPQIPEVGFSLIRIFESMILKHGSLVAVCVGGYIAFAIIRHFVKSYVHQLSEPSGEWEDYLTAHEENQLYSGNCSFDREMKIRSRCYARMHKAIKKWENS